MRAVWRAAAVFGLLSSSAAIAETVDWQTDYVAAFEAAKARNVPVLICLNMDRESANDELAERVYRDPDFVAACKDYVCVAGSVSEHVPSGPCPRFGKIECAHHQSCEKKARAQFIGGSVAIAPQHILAAPTGEILARRVYTLSRKELVDLMKEATAALKLLGTAPKKGVTSDARFKDLRERAKTRDRAKIDLVVEEVGVAKDRAMRLFAHELVQDKKMAQDLRTGLIDRFGERGNLDSVDVLLELLADKDPDIVIAAAKALEVIEVPVAADPLLKLLKGKQTDAMVCVLLRALGACGAGREDVRDALLKKLSDSNPFVRCNAALGAGYMVAAAKLIADDRAGGDAGKKEAAALNAALGESTAEVRGAAAFALGYARVAEARPMLEKALAAEKDAGVKECIAAAVANLDAKGPPSEAFDGMRWRFTGGLSR